MSDIYLYVAALGYDPNDCDIVKEFEEAVVSLLQCGSTYQRTSKLCNISIVGVMQIAHSNDIHRSEARKNIPVTNESPILSVDELCAVLDAKVVE